MGKKIDEGSPGPIGYMWLDQTTNVTQADRGKIVYSIKFLSPERWKLIF